MLNRFDCMTYDIYCHLSEGEAFGLAIVEAMGAGLPAILNDTATI